MGSQNLFKNGSFCHASCNNRWIPGMALILIGLLILAGQVVESHWLGLLFLPALGVILLAWGVGVGRMSLLIPGGILSGLGLGAWLVQTQLGHLGKPATGGVFLLSLSLGFSLITAMSAFFAWGPRWWPLVPGVTLALVGAAMLAGGPAQAVVYAISRIWPLGLILFGLFMILNLKSFPRG